MELRLSSCLTVTTLTLVSPMPSGEALLLLSGSTLPNCGGETRSKPSGRIWAAERLEWNVEDEADDDWDGEESEAAVVDPATTAALPVEPKLIPFEYGLLKMSSVGLKAKFGLLKDAFADGAETGVRFWTMVAMSCGIVAVIAVEVSGDEANDEGGTTT